MRYIKLSEKILEWEWFTDANMVKLWIYLLLKAQQFEDTRYKGIELKKGQLVTGRKLISKETGLSEREVRTCLNRLKSTNEITIESTNKYSVITIVKYDYYQANESYGNQQNDQQLDQQATSKRPASDQQATTSKRDKRDKRDISCKEEITKEESLPDCSPEFAKALKEFEKYRRLMKRPLTEEAKKRTLNDLNKLAPDEETQIAILHQSIDKGWIGVFPLQNIQAKGKEPKGLEALMQI